MKNTKLFAALLFVASSMAFIGTSNPDKAYAAACVPPADYGSVTQTISIPSTGTYRVSSRIMAVGSSNSYLLQIDGNTCIKVGDNQAQIPENVWTWVSWKDSDPTKFIDVSLTSGNHSIVMYGSEPDVKLDRVIFTTDTSCVPTGTGDNCANPPDTTPPVVSITSPANGATVTGTTAINASASDDSGIVSKVEFYVDGSLKSTDTTAPFSYSFNTSQFSVGSHTVYARAYDAANNNSNSSTITVTIPDTTNPTVGVTSPTSGATLAGTVAFTANASDNIAVTKVEFYVDGQLKGTDTASPYSISLDTKALTNASHSFTAKAFDAANNQVTSAAVSATVNNPVVPPPDTTKPLVDVTSPATGSTISGSIDFSATATDNVAVGKVELYVDGALVATVQSSPYTTVLDTTTLTDGSHSLSAKAFDTSNNTATSTTVSVTVRNTVIIDEDINSDGKVDILDFSILASKFNQTGSGLGRSDINSDGRVDILDFSRLASKFGSGA